MPLIGAEFDKFLCAPIGEDRNGTTLSVLSALARLDVDPWQEAASLARMPSATAVMRLTALIATLPNESTKEFPAKAVVDDLIALLPKSSGHSVHSTDSAPAVVSPRQTQIRIAISALIVLILIISALSASLSSAPENGAKPAGPPVADATTALPYPHNP
jgi:hypothetical protein